MPKRKWERRRDCLDKFTLDAMEEFSSNELIKKAQYGYVDREINNDNFSIHVLGADERNIVLVKFRAGMLLYQALEEASKLNFKRPRYEHAILFGAQRPEFHSKSRIIFLHEPWFGLDRRRFVIVLEGNENGYRSMGLREFNLKEGWWFEHFAFIER